MGYTHYWSHDGITPEQMAKIAAKVESIATLVKPDIPLGNWSGDDEGTPGPVFGPTEISFNGIGRDAHESFRLGPVLTSFDFCKTARKPYDLLVVATLMIADSIVDSFDWRSDGAGEPDMFYDAQTLTGLVNAWPSNMYEPDSSVAG